MTLTSAAKFLCLALVASGSLLASVQLVRIFSANEVSLVPEDVEILEPSWTAPGLFPPSLRRYEGNVGEDGFWRSAPASEARFLTLIAEAFACDLDFDQEVRSGDLWRVFVHQSEAYVLEYERGARRYQALLAPNNAAKERYLAPDGTALCGEFRRSPVRHRRISSGFSKQRFHPILQRLLPHHGVDYAADYGAPVVALADGVVSVAGYRGTAGWMVAARHQGGYETRYKHLSRLGIKAKTGASIKRGELIGFVGDSGLATGAHLHFELLRHGQYLNPRQLPHAAKKPPPGLDMVSFRDYAQRVLKMTKISEI